MPLTRYQIRNEYGLADPELYRAADKDDPEALLEGVAMAGLVGVLRQLGDLAEFAAEIFHDLHEEVMATAARGHGLMARVQQLEAEFPSIEKAFLSQTDHSLFFHNSGVDWHPNLRAEQSLVTRGDLPRFVMDSYEECRGPPRLFLLDKFDVAGAGACLKRYTDPSFFKVEAVSSGISTVEVQREKKIRKIKKRGARWRNGDTPEIVPTSHTKLHQLFLEERVENGHPDPARLVKLKRRQFNGSPLEAKDGKSYMEKILGTPSPEHKVVCEVPLNPLLLKMTSDNSSDSGIEIVDIGVVSPVEKPSPLKEKASSSPNTEEVVLKPFTGEFNGREIVKDADVSANGETDESPPSILKMAIEEELAVDADNKIEGSLDDHSDDLTSEVDNYMDALTTMESEMETDNEYKYKNGLGFSNLGKHGMDSDANEEQPDAQANFSDSQSIGYSSLSDDVSSLFKKARSSSSCSGSVGNMAENTTSDIEGGVTKVLSTETCSPEAVDLPLDNPSISGESSESKCHKLVVSNDKCTEENKTPDCEDAPRSSPLADSNTMCPIISVGVGRELEEASFDSVLINSRSINTEKTETFLDDSSALTSNVPVYTSNGTSSTVSCESPHVDKSDNENFCMPSDAVALRSNVFKLDPEKKGSGDSVTEVHADQAGESCTEILVERNMGTSVMLLPDSSNDVQATNLVCETNEVIAADTSENLKSVVDITETESINDHQCPEIVAKVSQVGTDLAEARASHSEEMRKSEELSEAISHEEMVNSIGEVDSAKELSEAITHEEMVSSIGEVDSAKVSCIGTDLGEARAPYSYEMREPEELSRAIDHEEMVNSTGKVDSVGDVPPCEILSDYSHKLDCEAHMSPDDVATETVQTDGHAVFGAVISGTNDNDINNVICNSSDNLSRNPTTMQESLSTPEDLQQRELDLHEEISSECLPELEGQEDVEQVVVSPTDLGSVLHSSISDDYSNLEPTEQSSHPPLMDQAHTSSEAQEEVKLVEVAPADLGSILYASVSGDCSNLETCNQACNPHSVEQTQIDSDVCDLSVASPSEQNQELESIPRCQSCAVGNNDHDCSSSSYYMPDAETFFQESVDQIGVQCVHPSIEEASYESLNLQTSATDLSEPHIPSEQKLKLQHDQHDGRCFWPDEVKSKSLALQPEQTQSLSLMDHESCVHSSSCPDDLPGPEVPTQLTFDEHNGSKLAPNPFGSPFPSFGVLPVATQTQVNLEEMPPLPPLPPMQWRMGKVQSIPLVSDRELIDKDHGMFPQVLPFTSDGTSQFEFQLSDREIAQSSNPFLSVQLADGERLQQSAELTENNLQPPTSGLTMPTIVHVANTLQERLDETQSLNPFLSSTEIPYDKPVHGSPALEGESWQSSSIPFSLVPSLDGANSEQNYSQNGLPIQLLNHLASESTPEAKVHEQGSQNSGREEGNSPDKSSGEQQQGDLASSQGEATWFPNTTLALPPTYEVGKPNGNKLPRPRNPLIDAVAAHGKLRKVTERVRPQIGPKVEERDSLLEQIRTKSFNLKPATTTTRPSIQGIQGPKTNLRVAAILEKANAIRQALAGSDEDDDSDGWSDS